MSSHTGMLISQDTPMRWTLTPDWSVVVAQLVEAAHRARDGDREATSAHIAHAIAHLGGIPSLGASGPRLPSNVETRSVARGALPAWKMRKIIAHVEANLSRRIFIQELARLVGLSASHFCRAFKCTFGASPRDYMLRRRVEIALVMKPATTETVAK